MLETDLFSDEHALLLSEGGIAVIPTDTLYGVVASALVPDAVERIYALKHRDTSKPLIVLISDIDDLERFGVVLSDDLRETLVHYWPGRNSIILPTVDETFEYLARDGESIAFRLPDDKALRAFLRDSGPLVAPSANPEGLPPAKNVDEARRYFGDQVDAYIDAGVIEGSPSRLIDLSGGSLTIIRG